jgi:hypothetical protein
MADKPVVHIGENSPEEVAYKLLVHVASAEGYRLPLSPGGEKKPDRKWLLDAYAECIDAVQGNRFFVRT